MEARGDPIAPGRCAKASSDAVSRIAYHRLAQPVSQAEPVPAPGERVDQFCLLRHYASGSEQELLTAMSARGTEWTFVATERACHKDRSLADLCRNFCFAKLERPRQLARSC